jgi:hypothetical protein
MSFGLLCPYYVIDKGFWYWIDRQVSDHKDVSEPFKELLRGR